MFMRELYTFMAARRDIVKKMFSVLQMEIHMRLIEYQSNVYVRIVYLYCGQTSELHHLYSQIALLIQEPLLLGYALLHFHGFHGC